MRGKIKEKSYLQPVSSHWFIPMRKSPASTVLLLRQVKMKSWSDHMSILAMCMSLLFSQVPTHGARSLPSQHIDWVVHSTSYPHSLAPGFSCQSDGSRSICNKCLPHFYIILNSQKHLSSLSLFWKERETSEFAGNKETVRAGLGSPTAVLVGSTDLTAPLGWHSFPSDLQSAISSASVHPRLLQTGHALFPVLPCSSCGFQGEPGVPSNPARLLLPFSLPNPLVFPLPIYTG